MGEWHKDRDSLWLIKYKNNMYEIGEAHLSALFVIDYMRRRKLENLFVFSLVFCKDKDMYALRPTECCICYELTPSECKCSCHENETDDCIEFPNSISNPSI